MATLTVWFAVNYTEAFTRGRAAKPRPAKVRPKSITQSTEFRQAQLDSVLLSSREQAREHSQTQTAFHRVQNKGFM